MLRKNFILIFFLIAGFDLFSQKAVVDSLVGFDKQVFTEEAKNNNVLPGEYLNFINLKKREFIIEKFKSKIHDTKNYSAAKPLAELPALNVDFELGNFNGWNLYNGLNSNSVEMTGTFTNGVGTSSLVSGGTDVLTGLSLVSPLGGNFVARVNHVITGAQQCKIQNKIFVTPESNLLRFAYAAVLQKANHECKYQPYFAVTLRDTLGNLLFNYFVEAPDTLLPNPCKGYNQPNFIFNGSQVYYSSWKTKCVDLTAYTGTNIFLEVIGASCPPSAHYGYGYFDAKLETCPDYGNPNILTIGTQTVSINKNILYYQNATCSGSISATAPAWPNYFNWNGPAISGIISSSLQSITTIYNGLHTLSMGNSSLCPITKSIYFSNIVPPLTSNYPNGILCHNNTYTFSVSGASTYTWGNNQMGQSIVITPTSTGLYTLSVSATYSNGCVANKIFSLNVIGSPTLAVAGNTITCGTNPTLQATGALTYYWYSAAIGGTFTSSNQTIIPTLYTNTISLTGTSLNGCVSNSIYTITNIIPLSNINSANSSTNICLGSNCIFYINGPTNTLPPNTYSLSDGVSTSTINAGMWIALNPTVTTTYTISGSNYCNSNSKTITVNVSTLTPAMSFTPLAPYCSWNYSLNLSGADSYTFAAGLTTTQSVAVLNAVVYGTTYTVTGKLNNSACTSTQVLILNPVNAPTINITPVSPVCGASSATFNMSGGNGIYSVTPLTAGYFTISPTFTVSNSFTTTVPNNLGIYKVQSYDNNGCYMTNDYPFSVLNPPNLILSIPNPTICTGQSTFLQAFGVTSYTWSTGSNSNIITVSPTVNTTYSLVGANSCASVFTTGIVYYNPSPIANITITPSNPMPCKGVNFTMTASGATAYTWTPLFQYSAMVVTNINVPTLYAIDYRDANGCKSAGSYIYTISPQSPTLSISGPDSVCAQVPQLYFANGANTYTWNVASFGGTTSIIGSSYTLNTNNLFNYSNTFTLSGTDLNGCTAKSTRTIISLAKGSIITNTTLPFCPASSDTLFVTNISPAMNSFTWSNGPISNSIIVSPTVNTVYTVMAKYNQLGCITQTIAGVSLHSVTPVTFSLPGNSFCESETPLTIVTNPTNATVYFGCDNNIFYPSVSGVYTLNCYYTNGNNCNSLAGPQTITVLPKPTVSLTIAQNNMCIGAPSVALAGSPLSGTFSGANVVGSVYFPLNSGNSSVVYSYTDLNGCSNFDHKCVNVLAQPQVAISGNDSICFGQSSVLTATGAVTYSWNNGATSSSIQISPIVSTTYSVIGFGTCSNSATYSITVNSLPNLSLTTSNTLICIGETVTLSANGANTYSWSSGGTNNTEVVSPTVTTSYTLIGVDVNGCQNTAVITQSVDLCTGLGITNFSNSIAIYPNPFNSIVIIISNRTKMPLQVINSVGSIIYESVIENKKTEIDLSMYSAGIYFIKIGFVTKKLIKE